MEFDFSGKKVAQIMECPPAFGRSGWMLLWQTYSEEETDFAFDVLPMSNWQYNNITEKLRLYQ